MITTNSLDEIKCKKFGYARIKDNIIVKVKPASDVYYANGSVKVFSLTYGFVTSEYTIIEFYDFFTKENHPVSDLSKERRDFFYNETDAYFSGTIKKYADLNGIFESKDIFGCTIIHHLSNGVYHCDENSPAIMRYSKTGVKQYEAFYVNGKLGRPDPNYFGPVEIYYECNGYIIYDEW